MPAASIRHVLLTLGHGMLDVLAVPAGLDVHVTGITIFDPEEELAARPGELVLAVGLRGRSLTRLIRGAGQQGAAGVVVKLDADRHLAVLREAANEAGMALLAVAPGARWAQLTSLIQGAIGSPATAAMELPGDLFALAQTIASTTGGIVSIEDPSARVLAYSGSVDEADELRRLSILGRRGPESYLAMLRQWGVYERLRSGEQVVDVAERPDLGIRRRMAVGIHAGEQYLGTIWVQEGDASLRPDAARTLIGAARVVALSLIRRHSESSAPAALREQLLVALLDGRADPALVAVQVGADPTGRVVVVAFTIGGAPEGRPSQRGETEALFSRMARLVAVHAAAYRRAALVTVAQTRGYVLLPDLPANEPKEAVVTLTREIVAAARGLFSVGVRAAVGAVVDGFEHVAASRAEADRVLDALVRDPDTTRTVATFDDVRPQVLLSEIHDLLVHNPQIRDDRLLALAAEDARRGIALAASLAAYLDAFGDVAAAAATLHVHPNTLRYRVRRATEITGLDLADPRQRLIATLQLGLPS